MKPKKAAEAAAKTVRNKWNNMSRAEKEMIQNGVRAVGKAAFKALTKGRFNHPEWYANTEYFQYSIGVNYAENKAAVLFDNKGDTKFNVYSPILGRDMEICLTTASYHDDYQSYTAAITRIRQQLTASSGREPTYTNIDISDYEYNVRTVFAMLTTATRAWMACHNTNPVDTSIPSLYGSLLKVDIVDWTKQIGAIADALRIMWGRFLTVYPISGTIFDRTWWMFINAFADYDGLKPSIVTMSMNAAHLVKNKAVYSFNTAPIFHGVFDRVTYPTASNVTKWESAFSALNTALTTLENYYGNSTQLSDRQRSYGFATNDKFQQMVNDILSNATITLEPVTDEYMLRQMQNAVFIEDFVRISSDGSDDSDEIIDNKLAFTYKHMDNGLMHVAATRTFSNTDSDGINYIKSAHDLAHSVNYINGYQADLSGDMLKSITRLHPLIGEMVIDSASETETLSHVVISFGSEVPVRSALVLNWNNGLMRAQETLFYYQYLPMDDDDLQVKPASFSFYETLASLTNIDYSPMAVWALRVYDSAAEANELTVLPLWDFAMFADVPERTIKSLNSASMYALLHKDMRVEAVTGSNKLPLPASASKGKG